MKCEQCGQKITHRDSYCGECGKLIQKDVYKKKCRKRVIKFGIFFILFSLFLFSGIEIILYFHSPKYIAVQYFNAVTSSDIDKVYSYIQDKESLFVSETVLKEKNSLQKNIEDVQVIQIYEKGAKTYVVFSYLLNGKNTISYVELKKKKIFNFEC